MNPDDLELDAKKLLAILRRGMERVSGTQRKMMFSCDHTRVIYGPNGWECSYCGVEWSGTHWVDDSDT